ncbi:hypothetical protein M8C21_002301, partial [Ambrosia artemisiifolia]
VYCSLKTLRGFYRSWNLSQIGIRGSLEKCTFDHEARIENLQNDLHEKALSDEKWRNIQNDLCKPGSGSKSIAEHIDVEVFGPAYASRVWKLKMRKKKIASP